MMARETLAKVERLLTDRRWEVLAVLSNKDMSGTDMAVHFDVYWPTFRAALERMDLPEGIKIPAKGKRHYNGRCKRNAVENEKRNQEIVGFRKQGLRYQKIADMYGITRERVRQILAMHGADGRLSKNGSDA